MRILPNSLRFYVDIAVFKWRIYVQKLKLKGLVRKSLPITLMPLADDSEFTFMSLFCHKDVHEGIVAFKSLYRFLDDKYPLTIIEDGTLKDSDVLLVKHHLRNVKIIRKKQADIEVNGYLKGLEYEKCISMRNNFVMALKLFDASFYSLKRKVCIIDTDIIFFKKPIALIDLINRKTESFRPFYNQDLHSVYSYKLIDLENFAKTKLLPAVNAGFIGWVPEMEIFTMTENFLSLNLPYESPWLVEQTMYALYFSQKDGHPLPEDYDVMARYARKGLPVVCQHYAGFLRPHFYRQFLDEVYGSLI